MTNKEAVIALEDLRGYWNVYVSVVEEMGAPLYSASAHPRAVCALGGDTWLDWVAYGEGPNLAGLVADLCAGIRRMGDRVITEPAAPEQL